MKPGRRYTTLSTTLPGSCIRGASVFAAGVLIAVIFLIIGITWWQIPLFIGSIIGVYIAWQSYAWVDPWARYLSFGGAVFLAACGSRILFVADVLIFGDRFHEWPFEASSPQSSLIKGEVVSVLGLLVTIAVWGATGGAKYSLMSLAGAPGRGRFATLFPIYVASLGAGIIVSAMPAAAEAFGQFIPALQGAGVASAFFLSMTLARSTSGRFAVGALLSLPCIYASLGSGMKQNVILAFLPAGLVLWMGVRNLWGRVLLVAVGVAVIALTSSYVAYYRTEVWYGRRDAETPMMLDEFFSEGVGQNVGAAIQEGLLQFVARSNASVHHGWAVSLADQRGYEPYLVFGPLAYALIPRVLWSTKPEIKQAWEYNGLLFGDDYLLSSESSSASGLFAGLYLGGGWPAVAIGGFVLGVIVSGLTRLGAAIGGATLTNLFGFTMIPFALRLEETWAVGALVGPVVSFAFLAAITLSARVATGGFGPARVAVGGNVQS